MQLYVQVFRSHLLCLFPERDTRTTDTYKRQKAIYSVHVITRPLGRSPLVLLIDGQMGGTARPGPGTPRHGTTRHGTPGHEKTFVPCHATQRAGLEAQARH